MIPMDQVSRKFGGVVRVLWDKFQAKPLSGPGPAPNRMLAPPPVRPLRLLPAEPVTQAISLEPPAPRVSSPYALILQNAEKDKRLEGGNTKLLRKFNEIDNLVTDAFNEKIRPKVKQFCPVRMYKTVKISLLANSSSNSTSK